MNIIQKIKLIWLKIPADFRYILKLFFATRLAFILIGYLAFWYISKIYVPTDISWHWPYPKEPWLKMWAVWDSGWYLDIAKHGYSATPKIVGNLQANIGFFPLFPWLTKAFGLVIRNIYVAGLILSNLFLICSGYILLLLSKMRFGEKTAKRVVKYLFLFPTAFILSGFNPESLFLLLSLLCFYFAEKEKWQFVGIFGFLLGLTKPTAIILVPALLLLQLSKQRKIRSLFDSKLLFLLGIPVGMLVFALFCRHLTGDLLAYVHIQQTVWKHHPVNLFVTFRNSLNGSSINAAFDAWFTLCALALIIIRIKKIPIAYSSYIVLLIISIASNGALFGILRYLASAFPLFFALALLTENEELDHLISYPLVLLQGALFIFWTSGFWFIS